MKKEDLTVGQSVVMKPVGNRARYSSDLSDGIVTKIGREYFYVRPVNSREDYKISLETGYHIIPNYGNGRYKVYLSKKEVLDEVERDKLHNWLRPYFDWGSPKLSLQQLKEIELIIKSNTNQ